MGDGQSGHFPRIGSYGFLSDCHTSALVSYDGSVEWLCLPCFDSPSVFTALLDRGAGHFRVWPEGVVVPISRRYEPGTLILETTWVTDTGWVLVIDSLSIGEWAPEGGDGGRPQTGHESDSSLLRIAHCIDGEVDLQARVPSPLQLRRRGAHLERRSSSGIAVAEGDGALSHRQHRLRAERIRRGGSRLHPPSRGRVRVLRDRLGPGAGRTPQRPRGARAARVDSGFLARVASPRRLSRPSLANPSAALGPGAEGPHLRPHGGDRRGCDHLAARDSGGRAQLGLPLQLDPRLDLLALGDAHPRLRRGGPGLHGVPRRRTDQGPGTADHVRGGRAKGPDRAHPRPPLRL